LAGAGAWLLLFGAKLFFDIASMGNGNGSGETSSGRPSGRHQRPFQPVVIGDRQLTERF